MKIASLREKELSVIPNIQSNIARSADKVLSEVDKHPLIRVLALGENHYPQNQFHLLVEASLAALKTKGFTHLCIELPTGLTSWLRRYLDDEISLDEFRQRNPQKAVDLVTELRILVEDKYYLILRQAHGLGYSVLGVDQIVGDRDCYMAEQIENLLNQSPENKIVFWAGRGHMFRRPIAQLHKAATELLDAKFGLESVYSVSQCSKYKNKFRPYPDKPFESGPKLITRSELSHWDISLNTFDFEFQSGSGASFTESGLNSVIGMLRSGAPVL